MSKVLQRLQRFAKAQEGSATVEYMLWLPMVLGVFALITDATMLMQSQSQFFLATRDASRQVALGQRTEAEVEDRLRTQFSSVEGFQAQVSQANGFVTASVGAPYSSFTIFVKSALNGTLSASTVMWVENYEG